MQNFKSFVYTLALTFSLSTAMAADATAKKPTPPDLEKVNAVIAKVAAEVLAADQDKFFDKVEAAFDAADTDFAKGKLKMILNVGVLNTAWSPAPSGIKTVITTDSTTSADKRNVNVVLKFAGALGTNVLELVKYAMRFSGSICDTATGRPQAPANAAMLKFCEKLQALTTATRFDLMVTDLSAAYIGLVRDVEQGIADIEDKLETNPGEQEKQRLTWDLHGLTRLQDELNKMTSELSFEPVSPAPVNKSVTGRKVLKLEVDISALGGLIGAQKIIVQGVLRPDELQVNLTVESMLDSRNYEALKAQLVNMLNQIGAGEQEAVVGLKEFVAKYAEMVKNIAKGKEF